MKKSIFAIAAISVTTSSIFYSCKKDNTPTPETTDQPASVKRAGMNYMEQAPTYYQNLIPVTYDCGSLKGTCVGGVVIKPKINSLMTNVLYQGDAIATGKFFANEANHQYISAVILNDSKLMEFLSSGEAHSKLLTSSPNKDVYLIGQSADLTVNNSLVMPVAIQD
jgi:hypothetical protein